MFFAVADIELSGFKAYPTCKVCKTLVVSEKFIAVVAIDELAERIGVVCEECCQGRKEVALELFQVNYKLTGKV